jgi:hypothetical protein
LTPVIGASAAPYGGHADGADEAYVRAIQQGVIERMRPSRTDSEPVFLIQIGVARSLVGVGVSSASDTLEPSAWRSSRDTPPLWRFWARRKDERAVTMAVIDARNGKTIAWSSAQVRDEPPAIIAERLVGALNSAQRP